MRDFKILIKVFSGKILLDVVEYVLDDKEKTEDAIEVLTKFHLSQKYKASNYTKLITSWFWKNDGEEREQSLLVCLRV